MSINRLVSRIVIEILGADMTDETIKNLYQKKSTCFERRRDLSSLQRRNKVTPCKQRTNLGKEEKSSADRDYLIRKYAHMVEWVVNRLPVTRQQGIEKDDLIGYATIGLIEAVDRFNPEKNSNFESYAIARIRGAVYDHLRSSDWLTRSARKRVKNLLKVTNILENKLGRYPNDSELAKELSVSLEELRSIQQEAQIGIFSLDEPRDNYSEDSPSLVDNISSGAVPVLEKLEENELKVQLAKAIDALPNAEKTVVGLYHYKKLTFKQIAQVMNFSESRASQIHARAVSLLKAKILKD